MKYHFSTEAILDMLVQTTTMKDTAANCNLYKKLKHKYYGLLNLTWNKLDLTLEEANTLLNGIGIDNGGIIEDTHETSRYELKKFIKKAESINGK